MVHPLWRADVRYSNIDIVCWGPNRVVDVDGPEATDIRRLDGAELQRVVGSL
jgi:hypothetical protein